MNTIPATITRWTLSITPILWMAWLIIKIQVETPTIKSASATVENQERKSATAKGYWQRWYQIEKHYHNVPIYYPHQDHQHHHLLLVYVIVLSNNRKNNDNNNITHARTHTISPSHKLKGMDKTTNNRASNYYNNCLFIRECSSSNYNKHATNCTRVSVADSKLPSPLLSSSSLSTTNCTMSTRASSSLCQSKMNNYMNNHTTILEVGSILWIHSILSKLL